MTTPGESTVPASATGVIGLTGPMVDQATVDALAALGQTIRQVDVEADGVSALEGCWAYVLGGTEFVGAEAAAQMPESVTHVCFMGTGYKFYMDVAALAARGITACYTPHANAGATAEFAVVLLLAGQRRLLDGLALASKGDWDPPEGVSLARNPVGVVGFGHIGQEVVRILHGGFGTPLLVWNRTPKDDQIVAAGATPASLEEIFATASAVTLHVDAPDQPLITAELLRSTKPGFVLVNTARAATVDHVGLAEVLAERPDIRVLSDVYLTEPVTADQDEVGLLALDDTRFALTPHMAYLSDSAAANMASMMAANLTAALQGGELPYPAQP